LKSSLKTESNTIYCDSFATISKFDKSVLPETAEFVYS